MKILKNLPNFIAQIIPTVPLPTKNPEHQTFARSTPETTDKAYHPHKIHIHKCRESTSQNK